MSNWAYIDGQNLTRGTMGAAKSWKIDLRKFRVFLLEKYGVSVAYYFIGVHNNKYDKLYKFIKKAGYKLVFREHAKSALGKKKGNVDTDIVFSIMDEVYRRRVKGKIVLVSGDGGYKKMVDRLIIDRKLKTIMFPNSHWSSLYNKMADQYKTKLYTVEVRKYLELSAGK